MPIIILLSFIIREVCNLQRLMDEGHGPMAWRDCDRDPAPAPAIASLLPSVADLPSGDRALTRDTAPICDDTTVPSDAITCAAHGAGHLHDISASD